jgi:hypothetical protein
MFLTRRKYMHAETLALLTKPLCFPNMEYCHGNTIILKIVLKLKNPPPPPPPNITFKYKMIDFPNIYMLGMLLHVI